MSLQSRKLDYYNINPIPFHILNPTHDTARVALYQCSGEILATNSVKNSDEALAFQKFIKFFELAKAQGAHLALTPEYSCPWRVITEIISNDQLHPPEGSIWAIGCESITPTALETIKAENKDKANFFYEDVAPNGKQTFLGPLVYLFNTVPEDGKPRLTALVQFKNHDMGGTFERDQLIKGSIRYEISNPTIPASIILTTLICADSLIFETNTLAADKHYLILHPQLNFEPYHSKMIDYKCKLFGGGNGYLYEVISLNWAKGFSIKGDKTSEDKGGTAYLMHPFKETEPNQKDHVIDSNYRNGVYLNFSQKHRYSIYLFCTQEAVFIFDSTKVSQSLGAPENRERSGLRSLPPYIWSGNAFVESFVADNIQESFEQSGGKQNLKPSERQKLFAISVGNISPEYVRTPTGIPKRLRDKDLPIYWHQPRNLEPYRLNGYESPEGFFSKLLNTQEQTISAAISQYFQLRNIVKDHSNLPEILDDYKAENTDVLLDLSDESEGSIRHNFVKENNKGTATVAYIGDTLPQYAKKKYHEMKETLAPSRLVIWYRHFGELKNIANSLQLVTDGEDNFNEFTREEDL